MRVIALFNLKPDVTPEAYEDWARSRDLPGVRSMPSVDDYAVHRTTGLLGGTGAAPYQYVAVLDIADMDGFDTDAAGPTSQAVAREFREFADGEPHYILTDPLD